MSAVQHQAVAQRGFTLLELLVVLLIVGMLVGLASLSLGNNEDRTLRAEAERIAALLELAAQEALLNGREMALELDGPAYRFLVYDPVEAQWQPLADPLFRARELPPSMALSALVEGLQAEEGRFGEARALRILILSSGEMSPFSLTVELEHGPRYELEGDMLGGLELKGPLET